MEQNEDDRRGHSTEPMGDTPSGAIAEPIGSVVGMFIAVCIGIWLMNAVSEIGLWAKIGAGFVAVILFFALMIGGSIVGRCCFDCFQNSIRRK